MSLAPSKIERYFGDYEFSTPYLLCASDCQSFTIGEILALQRGAEEQFQDLYLGYTESTGDPALKLAITSLYETMTPEDIMVFSGAEEGIFCAMHALLKEGDRYVVQSPNYQSLEEIPRSIGCRVDLWKMSHRKQWAFDMDSLKALVSGDTRMIALNNPHNPTGALMEEGQLREVIALAENQDSYFFSDEVYRFSEYDPQNRLPAVCDLYRKGISLGVMSKSFGLPGLRIGWIASKDQGLHRRMAELKDYLTICSSAPAEFLATVALRAVDHIMDRNLGILRTNLTLLDGFFNDHQDHVRWVRPKAGPVSMPEILPEIDMHDFCDRLRKESGVLILPGSIFNYDERHFRLGLGRKNLPEALDKFSKFLRAQF